MTGTVELIGNGSKGKPSAAAVLHQGENLLLGQVGVQRAAVSVHAESVRLRPSTFPSRAFRLKRGAGPGGNQGALEFRDGIQDATGERGRGVIPVGAFAGSAQDPPPFLATSRSIRTDRKASRARRSRFATMIGVAPSDRVEDVGEGRPVIDGERPRQPGVNVDGCQEQVQPGGGLLDGRTLGLEPQAGLALLVRADADVPDRAGVTLRGAHAVALLRSHTDR